MESEWAGRLRQIRRQHRLTQEALASELEVSQALISRRESGEIVPGRSNREKLTRYLEDPRHVSPYRRLRLMTQLNPSFSAILERRAINSLVLAEVSQGLRDNSLTMHAMVSWTGSSLVRFDQPVNG
ncbi:helix-turn-helix domain-containing protein [Woodsholea maritima]|uniref:helix-turn-helix domain-containing protein n=1 Tax=Woodsholea maritima TaxID=240237 RepID=UPI00037B77B8|nr:helix-turn-helix transcriptional regulator [Woodsholea maritima]